ncbi:MAG TPA: TonB-dependent receptor plug domain-containing protein, partial [Gemmatimonadaceae bacterium]|nr:TonB-dependent receptor plug domain-containing protein [Gemmatimonadaceae bacterium]
MRVALFIGICLAAGGGIISSSAAAQTAVKIDSVVTIGTRTTDRTATRSTVPIDVVTSASLQATGLPETWEALQRLIPSINVPRVPLTDNNLRPITLRGLSPDHVLVL